MADDGNLKFDAANLAVVVTYTDTKSFDIKCVMPMMIDPAGELVRDPARKPRYFSQVGIVWRGMPRPWNFEIDADTIAQAIERVDAAAVRAQREAVENLEGEARRAALLMGGQAPTPTRQ